MLASFFLCFPWPTLLSILMWKNYRLIIHFDVEELSYKTIARTIIVAILTKQGNIIFHNKLKI
ncbi:hypothetical protein C0J52_03003 [Blattella germanica]|nr:hypothetical protein C0J52_03003 [Blattella germanica]